MTPIVILKKYDREESIPQNTICVFVDSKSKINFIFRKGKDTNPYDTEWEIDPIDSISNSLRYYFGTERVTREQLLNSIQEAWPDDFETIIWNLELLDCEYHGIEND